MNKILLFILHIALLAASVASFSTSSSSSQNPTYLYSVSTTTDSQNQLVVLDPINYDVIHNFTIHNLFYQVYDILSLDTTTGELLLLCGNSNYFVLISVSPNSPKYTQLSEVAIDYSYNYAIQSFIYIADLKTATIPAQVSVNGEYSNFLMATEFSTQQVQLFNLTHLQYAPYTIQGYDYINNIDYIAYLNMNGSFHMMSFDFSKPAETAKYYYDISNFNMTYMIFADPSGNVYFLNQQYKNSSDPNGYFDICRVTLSDTSSCGPSLYTVYLGNIADYSYIPYVQSKDRSTLLFIINQAPGQFGHTDNILLTYVQLNGDSVIATNVTIPNDDPSGDNFSNRVYAF
ncbi:hypothetical protein DICPUDRAFT_158011 [Dictyostelium purpureum]|uniref:Uncharacterized protein n=1 Tax=Dictyostelium purpureum TaxID=5786 RepID=F1A0L0_DICPU|nr:uncharacterized protein DICPUDRAFT_158011 [Dictyostelium purpureum]EGC30278.1 hypothetical protein DICPUDRAFT_158011 [Dictyostelium purpureum]|eukprot:XP_003293205.1 hypothetical protein DICPUDRAFT_158011 [Dictyostelium purpureum]